ncbi:LysM peptidoglycan-binding domain-containing protein [Labrenzia sp. PHM005]|uniref:LysM peptidoglycan-binding domain-containing protein n=1 Tax=Labrenzia sp. PHM005 TaxID=2590016 RepID=UPI001140680C|nr:hypothetical protein [Labrenzia sp. PHM005]QDG74606.1 hypothetical protein FJ695_01270 [Labrenzia sp. PHM005]
MFIFAGVDGTGPDDDTQYKNDFKNSFVNQMGRIGHWQGYSYYTRGPTMAGTETGGLAINTFAVTMANYTRRRAMSPNKVPAVFLAGYSRGGAAILKTANMLNKANVPVECLVLFDAVDRTTTIGDDDTYVPPNVRTCLHVRRDPSARSRTNFGYCHATPKSPATQYTEKYFFCTHGGVGGTPWTEEKYTTLGYIDEYTDAQSRAGQVLSHLVPGLGGVVVGQTLPTQVTLAQEQMGTAMTLGWFWPRLVQAIAKVMHRNSDHSPAPAGPGSSDPQTGPANGNQPAMIRRHTVVSGESLSMISYQYYEDFRLFPLIYDANADQIGSNWNIIQPGMTFKIPDKKSFSTAELNAARQRARGG